jgi:acyl carrier protein
VSEDVLALLADKLTVVLGLDGSEVTAQTRFDEDLHADSLDLVEVVESVERTLRDKGYTVAVDDDVLLAASTVGEAAQHIAAGLSDAD